MKNYYQSQHGRGDEREIDTADFLRETGGLTLEEYQGRLENQAENLRFMERQGSRAQDPSPYRSSRAEAYRGAREEAYRTAHPGTYTDSGSTREGRTERYSRGYEDGYYDALEEINERLAAEEDDYDFGRHYSGKSTRKPKKRKQRVVYEEDYDEPVVVRRKRKKRSHPFAAFLLFLLILILAVGGFGIMRLLSKVTHIDPVADTVADEHAEAWGVPLEKNLAVKNILLIGSDKRSTEEERQRSDSMILCSINVRTGNIVLTSLMRDMYVPIPGYGSDKLNAAYAYGDVELLDETIQENFGVDINGNVLVDFDSFLQTLTSVGDIDIELSAEEAAYLNGGGWEDQGEGAVNDGTWNLQPGMNSLTPAQALAYCRIRYVGNSDWERTERQRRVVMAAFSKFKRSNPITQYRVLSGVMEHITTDMTDRALLATMFRGILSARGSMQTYLIPAEGTFYPDTIDGMAVLVPDLEQNRAYLKEYING